MIISDTSFHLPQITITFSVKPNRIQNVIIPYGSSKLAVQRVDNLVTAKPHPKEGNSTVCSDRVYSSSKHAEHPNSSPVGTHLRKTSAIRSEPHPQHPQFSKSIRKGKHRPKTKSFILYHPHPLAPLIQLQRSKERR